MTGREAIQAALEATRDNLTWFISDFTDADLFVRPVPNANHTAWQLGNVIAGDSYLLQTELPEARFPALPAGFMQQHGTDGARKDGPDGFLKKDEYLKLFAATRAATIENLMTLSDADLDRPCAKMKAWAPTLGHLFLLVSNHTLLHVGQFSVIRRKLDKPVLM